MKRVLWFIETRFKAAWCREWQLDTHTTFESKRIALTYLENERHRYGTSKQYRLVRFVRNEVIK